MKDIFDSLNRMINLNARIQTSNLPQIKKDEAMQIVSSSLRFVLDETSQTKINQLTVEEMRKRMAEKIKNDK